MEGDLPVSIIILTDGYASFPNEDASMGIPVLWIFEKQVKNTDRATLHKAILEGDTEGIGDYVSDLLAKSISIFDSEEAFYHGFFLSLQQQYSMYSELCVQNDHFFLIDLMQFPY